MRYLEQGIVNQVSDFLAEIYHQSAFQLIPTLYHYYSIDLYSYRTFKTLRKEAHDYCLTIDQHNQLELYTFNRQTRRLTHTNNPSYQTVFEIISWCLQNREPIENSRATYNTNLAKEALTMILSISYTDAKQLITQAMLVTQESEALIPKKKRK